jgi:hypothetical protein
MFRGGHARVVRHDLVVQIGAMISGTAITVEPPAYSSRRDLDVQGIVIASSRTS